MKLNLNREKGSRKAHEYTEIYLKYKKENESQFSIYF